MHSLVVGNVARRTITCPCARLGRPALWYTPHKAPSSRGFRAGRVSQPGTGISPSEGAAITGACGRKLPLPTRWSVVELRRLNQSPARTCAGNSVLSAVPTPRCCVALPTPAARPVSQTGPPSTRRKRPRAPACARRPSPPTTRLRCVAREGLTSRVRPTAPLTSHHRLRGVAQKCATPQ